MLKSLRSIVGQWLRRRSEARLQRNIISEFERCLSLNHETFPARLDLPPLWGRGLPERVPELLLAHLSYQAGTQVLDVGYANAMTCHLHMVGTLPSPRHFTGIDIASPTHDAQVLYEKCITGNVTDESLLPTPFDLIWCISTLEHIGMNNTGYTTDFAQDQDMDRQALQRMMDLLVPGGRLLITVPYGKAEDHGWLRNYDRSRWQGLLEVARQSGAVQEWYFRHTFGAGWQLAEPQELQYVGYYDQHNAGAGAMAAVLISKFV